MSNAWQCPVWHPGDCDGTPLCPPRCPRYVTEDGVAVTVYADEAGQLVAVDDDGTPLAGATIADGVAQLEVSEGGDTVGAEVLRQVVARAHEAGEPRLTVEAAEEVIELVVPELGEAVRARDPGRIVLAPEHPAASPLTLAPASGASVGAVERVDDLLSPAVVAVFGATDREGSIGRVLLQNLDDFEGTVLPVSDRTDELLGVETVSALSPGEVDLAVIGVPADSVESTVEEAIEAGVDAIAILSAGFGETDAAGTRRQERLEELLAGTSVTAIGPNALGVLSTDSQLNATFAPAMPPAGTTSLVSHSGAMITAVLDWATTNDVGMNEVVSLGNGIDLTAAELVRHWGRDGDTEVIAAYLEDLPDGRAFVEAARDVTPTTPIVALKSGRTGVGAKAANSHTGAMAGDDAGYEAAFDAAGVIRAASQDEWFDLLGSLSSSPLPRGDRVAIVTNAGGPGVIATDAVAENGLELATFAPETKDRLTAILPAATSVSNPLDILGDADEERCLDAVEYALADPGVGAVLFTSTPNPLISLPALVEGIDALVERYGVPVFTCFPGVQDAALEAALTDSSVSGFSDANRAARTLSKLVRYTRDRRQPRASIDPIDADSDSVVEALDRARTEGRTTLGVESLNLLDAYGISIPDTQLVTSPETVQSAVEAIGGEAVLKVVSSDVIHKTDRGGVRTGVTTSAARSVYESMVADVTADLPDGSIEGVAVQEPIDGGIELIVGVTHHDRFGPIVTIGLGGVFTEYLGDVSHGLAPISVESARDLLLSLDGADMVIEGPRGSEPPNLDGLAETISRLSRLPTDHDAIRTLEVNPLIATPTDTVAVDLHLELER